MTKLSEIQLNQKYTLSLVVTSASARETKAGKPYLTLTLFDGKDSIKANYWDWTTGNVPPTNTIVDVQAQVSEWQGTKQLTIKSMSTNKDLRLSSFMPKSGKDINAAYADAYALALDITDDTLRDLTVSILEALKIAWLDMPGAVSVHHAYVGGTLVHSYSVAKIAKAIAEQVDGANVDLCVAGALLHDVGKLFSYDINGVTIDHTDDGRLFGHIFIGAEFVGNYAEQVVSDLGMPAVERKIQLLRHIILSHHGRLEYGSPVVPLCIEANIVHSADMVDATAEQLRQAGSKSPNATWTDRIWSQSNQQCLTPWHISEVMA